MRSLERMETSRNGLAKAEPSTRRRHSFENTKQANKSSTFLAQFPSGTDGPFSASGSETKGVGPTIKANPAHRLFPASVKGKKALCMV